MKKHDLILRPVFLVEDRKELQQWDFVAVEVNTEKCYRINQHTGKFLEWRYAVCEIPMEKVEELKNRAIKIYEAPHNDAELVNIAAEEIVAWNIMK